VQDVPPTVDLQDHVVLVGYGRVGRGIGEQLRAQGRPFVVIEAQREHLEALRQDGVPALYGNAAQSELLKAAAVERARWLLVAIPEVFEAGQVIENALELNAGLKVVARAHSDAEIDSRLRAACWSRWGRVPEAGWDDLPCAPAAFFFTC
jgi:CPA2 family monovalent cation:H+ antiporter-2